MARTLEELDEALEAVEETLDKIKEDGIHIVPDYENGVNLGFPDIYVRIKSDGTTWWCVKAKEDGFVQFVSPYKLPAKIIIGYIQDEEVFKYCVKPIMNYKLEVGPIYPVLKDDEIAVTHQDVVVKFYPTRIAEQSQ